MNRVRKFTMAALVAVLTVTACDEGTPPPVEPPPPPTPVGTISGAVTIEGTAATGITATLSSGATTTTGSGGNFAFSGVEAGTYTVTISGFPEDATFAEVTQSATIATDGQNVQLNFAGEYIRSSAVVGNVVAADAMMSGGDGQPETLGGVTVTLGGEHAMGETMETDMNGGFAFTGLRAGTYTVTISDFPEDVSFEVVSLDVEVGVGDVGHADFTGHFIRTSAVEGQVVIEGEGLAGVTVTLMGGPSDESFTAMTDADGMYRFEELRPGAYTVSISDFDVRDYEFASTSQDVSVDLDETGTVSFTGVLLRTSGISGRVSVEGMGLADITVTLAGGDDRTAMTDPSGQYAFSGLAAGQYTVSISVESAAYVFGDMSESVTLVDDQSAIVNFEGAHARTASVSGMAFIDEATKNDMYDDGEHPVAHAGLPVALVGPGVNEQRVGATDAEGRFSFTGLRAGAYQLVVALDAASASALGANDLAYGGSAIGYSFDLGVAEPKTQNLPFDITHTRVNFTATLRSGEEMGAALSGATVSLFSDAAGETKIGSGETGDDGAVMIRVARAGTSGNMVHASVSADGYHVADGMTAVPWNPQYNMTAATNANDILNLNVDVTFAGATITTDFGGGIALAGWAVNVTSGEDAVEGAPAALDEDGNAAFQTTVGADDLPASYSFNVADEQDDKLDGGEMFEGAAATHEHDGLSLMGTVDAGTIEVRYTTQTLMVSVYREVDQVPGFTGNIGTKDVATTCSAKDDDHCVTGVELEVRHETSGNRRGNFDSDVWDADDNSTESKGVYTFKHLPADHNVFVLADEIGDVEIVGRDDLSAFDAPNGMGNSGAFGAQGGFHHTVKRCPLMATDPTGQDFGECGSFAFVLTHTVAAHVKKAVVEMDDDDGFEDVKNINVPGVELSFNPVDGKNIAGEAASKSTLKDAVRSPSNEGGSPRGTANIDERQDLYFGQMAEGVYEVSVPTVGWGANVDSPFRLDDQDVEDVTDRTGDDGPFRSNDTDGVYIEVRPTTGTLYGVVRDDGGDPLEDVEVTVNGVTTETDIDGRYIVADFNKMASRGSRTGGKLYASFSLAGYDTKRDDPDHASPGSRYQIGEKEGINFEANTPKMVDVVLDDAKLTATVSGTVTDKDGEPVSGVQISVARENGDDVLLNPERDKTYRLTGDDGTYTLEVEVTKDDEDYTITPKKTRYYFDNMDEVERLEAGDEEDGVDFEALRQSRIRGSVRNSDGGLEGIMVTATAQGREDYAPSDETNANGRFTIWVDGDERYDVTAVDPNDVYTFNPPDDADGLRVDDDETHEIGTFEAVTFGAGGVKATRDRTEDDSATDADESERLDGNVTVTWNAGTVPTGETITYQAQTKVGDADWENFGGTAVTSTALAATPPTDSTLRQGAVPSDSDGGFMVRIVSVTDNGDATATPDTLYSAPVEVDPVDPMASGVTARRQDASDSDEAAADGDFIQASWSAVTNTSSSFRVVAQVDAAAFGGTVWVVLATGADSNARSAVSADISGGIASASIAIPSGTGGTGAVTEDELAAAIKIAVEWVQGTADATDEGPKWMRSAAVDLAARGS